MENTSVPLIDSHQHFWRYDSQEYGWIDSPMASIRRDFSPADGVRAMQTAGFQAGVAVQARQTLEETTRLLELADAYASIAGVVGWIDLQSADVLQQLEVFAAHPKLVGVRHVVQSEPDDRFLLRPEFCRGIALLEEFGLTYDILIYPRHLPVATEFVARFPRQSFVLDHLGKPDIRGREIQQWAGDLRRLAASPNVCAKLSGLVTEADWEHWTPAHIYPYLDVALDCFGAGRLMIGSDWPVCTLAGDYARVMRLIVDYLSERHLTEDERNAVLGGTAQRFWNLQIGSRTGTGVGERR